MKKIFVLVSALVALVTSFSANALADMSNPYTLANEVATTTVNEIKLKKNKLSDPDVGLEIIEKINSICYNYFIIKSCKSKWRTELTSEESNIQNLLLKDVEILKMLWR